VETNGHQSPERIRARLNHLIVDADVHWLEFGPMLREEPRRIGGDAAAEGFLSVGRQVGQSPGMSVAERLGAPAPARAGS
jgi:hypothetical protein